MESTKVVSELAVLHQIRLWAFFFLLLCLVIISLSLNLWAFKLSGWQPQLIIGVSTLVGGLSVPYAVYFGILIRSAYKELPMALKLSHLYDRDEAAFLNAFRNAVGPIQWK